MGRPKIYDAVLRKALIVRAADIIADLGVEALVLRNLAADVGTSTNAIYTMFGSKDQLVAEVVDVGRAQLQAAQEAVPETDNVLEDLIRLGVAYRKWAQANPSLYLVIMDRRIDFKDEEQWLHQPVVRSLTRCAQRAIDEATLKNADLEEVCMTLWAAVHGVCSLELGQLRKAPPEKLDAMFRHTIMGLLNDWL